MQAAIAPPEDFATGGVGLGGIFATISFAGRDGPSYHGQ